MEEAARVVSLNYSIMGNKIFYTIHAEVFIYVAMYDNWLLVILRKNVRERKVEYIVLILFATNFKPILKNVI